METRQAEEYPGAFIDSTFQAGAPKDFTIPDALVVGRTIHHKSNPVELKVLDWGTAQDEAGGVRKPAFRVSPIENDQAVSDPLEPYVIVYEAGMENDYTYGLTPAERFPGCDLGEDRKTIESIIEK